MIILERILRAKKDLALFCKKPSKWQLSDIAHGKFHSYNLQYMAKKKVTTVKEHLLCQDMEFFIAMDEVLV
jgi:hypothetical protein